MLTSLASHRATPLTGRSMRLPYATRPRLWSFGGRSGLAGGSLAGGLLRPHLAGASFRGLPAVSSSRGRSGGRGRGEGRSWPGRGGGRTTRGHGGGGPEPEDLPDDDPASAQDLGALERLVRGSAATWMSERNTRRLTKACSAAAKLGSRSLEDVTLRTRILDTLAAAYAPLVPHLEGAVDCIIPLYACSRAGYWGPGSADGKGGLAVALLQRLSADGCNLLTANRTNATVQSHANLWLALSVTPAALRAAADLRGILNASAEGLLRNRALDTRACANVLLACARMQWRDHSLVHHLTTCLVEQGHAADDQNLANSLYALGKLAEGARHKPRPEGLRGLAEEVERRLSAGEGRCSFIPQQLSNMLLGCTKLGYTDPALINSLAAASSRAVRLFKPQELANSVWALAKMGFEDQGWYAAAVAAAEQPEAMQGAVPQNWSNLWYALALARHRPASRRLLERTAEAAALLRRGADAQACANLLWALANLRLYDERLVYALAGRLGELLGQDPEQLTGQNVCNSLWALAVMGPGVLSCHGGLVEGLLREAERRWAAEGGAAFSEGSLMQLWQAQVELAHVGGGELQRILRGGEDREGSLLVAMRVAAATASARLLSAPSLALATEVASALEQLQQRMGPGAIVSVQRRCVVEEVGRCADALVELAGGRRVAVAAVRRACVFANAPYDRTVVGPIALSVRQVGHSLGAGNLASVPYWEWEAAKAKGEELGYLSRVLGLGERQNILPQQARPLFEEGARLLFRKWTALTLAVENQWGGTNSAEKAEALFHDCMEWFYKKREHYADELEEELDDALLQDFNVEAEDGSPRQVSEGLVKLYQELVGGSMAFLEHLRAVAAASVAQCKRQVVDLDGTVVAEEDADMETSSDEGGSDDDEDGMDTEGAPQGVPLEPAAPKVPVVDEDGFTMVQGKGRKGRR
ncbi:hypothetical protein HYH03_004152 [Edaphochlamys debaryana]|uniref:Uncharacterized protein n=1 Tax=Edaphochlamys debaryana TaxID=47281 RepID=A0A835YBP8_9CHLO|nr:hypothetical protein HYH03_004152 [Edaphochlamys debaryana]|eukprot:KAG2497886.1 hypothetical protein HYH03_004152 [Edaphochlamys debaryana]